MSLTILICGDRTWNAMDIMEHVFNTFTEFSDIRIISGGCNGADKMAHSLAGFFGFDRQEYPADWETHGKAAGPIRNQEMLSKEHPDLVIAFHDNIRKSKGTLDMITRARKAEIPVLLVHRKLHIDDVV